MDKCIGQSLQDFFVLKLLNFKRNGYFLEIGSNHPININNSFVLEKEYNWNGLMVEYDPVHEASYKEHRKCNYIIQDATKVDYCTLLADFPKNMDYLQIDLEVSNFSTLKTLMVLEETVMKDYTFSVVTFEHDIYTGDFYDTRNTSRLIFERNGYIRVFSDVKNQGFPYEDWYVHSSYPDMTFINKIKTEISMEYTEIMKIIS